MIGQEVEKWEKYVSEKQEEYDKETNYGETLEKQNEYDNMFKTLRSI